MPQQATALLPRGTPYVNTVPVNQQPVFPGNLAMKEQLASLVRWNALAMVGHAIPAGRVYRTLGTDGFGQNDTRATLWAFFGVDAANIERTALKMLGKCSL